MAHSNSTTNYSLPQFVSADKPAWLTDVNTAYADIDTGMHNAQVAADNAQSDATQALTDASAATTTATGADAKASGAIASISESFDTTATYSVGDYVIYNNLLYRCTVDVVTPGSWTGSANWTRTTLDNIITNLKIEDLSDVSIDNTDNNKLLGVSVSGDNISVTAVGELFKRVTFASSASITVPANGAVNITANDLNIITPTGYIPVAITSIYSTSNNVILRSFNSFSTGTASFGVARNVSGSNENVMFNVSILYIKSEFVSVVYPT